MKENNKPALVTALGVIIAAIITGLFSLYGNINTTTQKTPKKAIQITQGLSSPIINNVTGNVSIGSVHHTNRAQTKESTNKQPITVTKHEQ